MQQQQQQQMQMQMQMHSSTNASTGRFTQVVQPQEEGEVAASRAPSGGPAHDDSQSSTTTRTFEQVLQTALHDVQGAQTEAEVWNAVRTLALALGAVRTETSTIQALHAVLLQLLRPDMSDTEACASTAASKSNFFKWRRRVRDLAPSAQRHAQRP